MAPHVSSPSHQGSPDSHTSSCPGGLHCCCRTRTLPQHCPRSSWIKPSSLELSHCSGLREEKTLLVQREHSIPLLSTEHRRKPANHCRAGQQQLPPPSTTMEEHLSPPQRSSAGKSSVSCSRAPAISCDQPAPSKGKSWTRNCHSCSCLHLAYPIWLGIRVPGAGT